MSLKLPNPPVSPNWTLFVENISLTALTLDPNGLTLDGSSSTLSILTNNGLIVFTDGNNYFTMRGMGFANPMTTEGDLIYENALLVPDRLAIGTTGEVLTVSGGLPAWAAPAFVNPLTTKGDLLYEDATPAPVRLAIGSSGQVLTVSGGLPVWSAATGFSNPMTTSQDIIVGGSSGTPGRLGVGTSAQVLTVSGAGAVEWANASSGFANPMTTKGDLIFENATPAPDRLPIGTSGQVLTVVSGLPAWGAAGGGTVTVTGSPSSGNLAKFSGSSSITNADLTGDLTTSGGVATTLATVNSDVGSYTNANITVNGKGLITAAANGTGGSGGPSPTPRRWAYGATVNAGLSTIAGNWVGDGASLSGSISFAAASSGTFPFTYTTINSASTGTQARLSSPLSGTGSGWTIVGQNMLFQTKAMLTNIASIRAWVGVGAVSIATFFGTDTPAYTFAAFRFSTGASDANWQCITGDGSSQTVSDSGVAVTAGTFYLLEIKFNDATPNVVFSINGTPVATNTTHLPASGTALSYFAGMVPLVSSSKTFDVAWIYEEADS